MLPKQLEKHGLKKSNLSLNQSTIKAVIEGYTREAGVRTLERQIATICRKAARQILEEDVKKVIVNSKNLPSDFFEYKNNCFSG